MKKVIFIFIILNITDYSLFSQSECVHLLKFPFESTSFRRNDTVFSIHIYPSKERTDSIIYNSFAVKITNKKWKTNIISDGSYLIVKYKKIKSSQWFEENNGKLFQADYECVEIKYWKYYPNGSIDIYWRIGRIAYLKRKNKNYSP
jgi:hypothetical protein